MFTKQVSRPPTVPIPIVAGERSRSGNSKKDPVTGAFRGSCALHSPTPAASMSRPLPPEEIAYLEELPRRSRIRAMGVGELMRRLVSKASNDSSEEDHQGTQGQERDHKHEVVPPRDRNLGQHEPQSNVARPTRWPVTADAYVGVQMTGGASDKMGSDGAAHGLSDSPPWEPSPSSSPFESFASSEENPCETCSA